jgi:hypothetical protein
MTKNNTSSKLKKIIEKEEKESRAQSILEKIRQQTTEDEEKRKISEKFVEQFTKENGPIKYFRDQWFGTKVWRDAESEGYKQAQWESEDEHKDLIYKLVKKLTHGQS